MNINPINQNNTVFNANLKTYGYLRDVPSEAINGWKKLAENIGTQYDTVTLNIGKKTDKKVSINEFGYGANVVYPGRDLYIETDVAGEKKHYDLSYANSPYCSDFTSLTHRVNKFLYSLM